MPTDYYLQNLTFDRDRDIECGGDMVVGRDVLPVNRWLYTTTNHMNPSNLNTSETKKTQELGNVVLNSGNTLNLEAKTRVRIGSGFIANHGSTLKIKVDGTDPNTRSDKSSLECGSIKSRIDNSNTVYELSTKGYFSWNLKGYNIDISGSGNEFRIPSHINKGQYTLWVKYTGCSVASIVIKVNNGINSMYTEPNKTVSDQKASSLKVFPNPSNEIVTIELKSGIKEIKIFKFDGTLIYTESKVNSSNIQIKSLQLSSGTYIINVVDNDNNSFYEKLVIL
jgi:hypothetical protein